MKTPSPAVRLGSPRFRAPHKCLPYLLLGLCWLAAAFLCLPGTTGAQTPGTVDPTFNPGTRGVNGLVYSVVVQSDGKVIIGGDFTKVDGVARNRIARLNTNGSVDTAFNPGAGANSTVKSVVVQSDGKVIIGGNFTTVGGVARNYITRLNADGSVYTAFNPGNGADYFVYSVAVQSDGKMIIGGRFFTVGGVARNHIARLNADGSLDAAFNPGAGPDNAVNSIAVQSDGKIVIGGTFNNVGGVARARIARLNADGSLDTAFNPGSGTNSDVRSVAMQSDGKVIIGGSFITVNTVARNYIARLNANGSLDTAFNPGSGASNNVNAVAVQSDGKIVIGGEFTKVNGVARNHIARLNATGSLDTVFNPSYGADYNVYAVIVQNDGKLFIGGDFSYVDGVTRYYIARLNADGTADAAFSPGSGVNYYVYTVAVQSDGKIVIGGDFTAVGGTVRGRIARLNADGSVDTAFNPGVGADKSVKSVAVQSDGKVIIGGDFTTVGGVARNNVARLNANGSLDTAFDPGVGPNYSVYAVAAQSNGKVLIGGRFSTVGGVYRCGIARLNADGSSDTAFNTGDGVDGSVYSVVVQSDGKVFIAGGFATVNGVARNHVARLNANGSLDTAFNPGSAGGDYVQSMALQSNGKVLIGGASPPVDGQVSYYVARLNANGSLDTAFNPGPDGLDNEVNSVAVQSDGKVIVAGQFATVSGVTRNNLVRFNTDGSTDTVFNPGSGVNNYLNAVGLQSDGKVIIVGGFDTVGGIEALNVARLYGTATTAAPSVVAGTADTLQMASAVVRASVNAQGAATNAFFQYGLSTSYGSTTSSQNIGAGTTAVAVNATLTGLTPATTYHYRAVATNNVGTTNGADATFTTLTVAQNWRQQYFGTTANAGSAADLADPDGDGIVNLLERALGLIPTQPGRAGLPTVTRDNSTGRLTLSATKGAFASDLAFSAEASSDLVTWTTSGVTVLANTTTTFQARDDGPTGTRRFLRLRVSVQ